MCDHKEQDNLITRKEEATLISCLFLRVTVKIATLKYALWAYLVLSRAWRGKEVSTAGVNLGTLWRSEQKLYQHHWHQRGKIQAQILLCKYAFLFFFTRSGLPTLCSENGKYSMPVGIKRPPSVLTSKVDKSWLIVKIQTSYLLGFWQYY